MIDLKQFEVWFITGSQHLYGPETLKQVDVDSGKIADALNVSPEIPVKVVFKPAIHILAGEKVCIHVTNPTQFSVVFASTQQL